MSVTLSPVISIKRPKVSALKPVDDFVGVTRQSDDITCLVLRAN